MHFKENFEIRHSEITSEVFLLFFEGGQKYVQFLTNRISIVATHHTLRGYLKVVILCMEGVCGEYFIWRYLPEPFTKIYKLNWNSQ